MQIRYKNFLHIVLVITLIFTFTTHANAEKWRTMTFAGDLQSGIRELEKYCLVHDFKVEDIMWANKTSLENLTLSSVIFLPANQADLIAIWQHVGSANMNAPTFSMSDLELRKPRTREQPDVTPAPTPAPAPIQAQAPVQAQPQAQAPDLTLRPNMNAPTFSMEDLELRKPHTREKPDAKIVQAAIANSTQTSNNDAILTANPDAKKKKNEIPGLMDPIIIFSPNGDPSKGPMRLVISGDKVEVVQLPRDAAPKRPSMADLDHTFGTSPAYLPSYPATNNYQYPRANQNLFIPQNLNGKMMWPVDGKVTSGFGPRGKRRHTGLDIPMPLNTPIRAARDGVVARTGDNSTMGFRGYGNFVLVDHGNGVKTLYAHCSSVLVRQGQRIMQGQIIANVGHTGRATCDHVHFEVRINDKPVNPIPYLATNPRLASRSK